VQRRAPRRDPGRAGGGAGRELRRARRAARRCAGWRWHPRWQTRTERQGGSAAVASTDPTADDFAYDEFAYLDENVTEAGLDRSGPYEVERVEVAVAGSRTVSALRWGSGPVEVVFVHGSAQNAHTWDTVILALDRPALAVDLPG